MFILVSCDRWIRTRFPVKSQQICTSRIAVHTIGFLIGIDVLLHAHLFTPLFGPIAAGVTANCGANPSYSSYAYFYQEVWPMVTTLTVTVIPSIVMLVLLIATIINIQTPRKRILPASRRNSNAYEKRRSRFIHRQMFILMTVTLILFFVTTLPGALFRFVISTLKVQQPFSLSWLLSAVFRLLSLSNYSLNFYLHCLTSKFFRKQFTQLFPFPLWPRSNNNRVSATGKQHRLAAAHLIMRANARGRQVVTGC